MDSVKVVYSV